MPRDPQPYDHVRSDGTPVRAGSYRVVGVADDRVTLLRVADSNGKRVHEGELVSVDREEYGALSPADNPDEPSLVGSLAFVVLGGGLVVAEILGDALTTVSGILGVDFLADVLVVASALVFAIGVRRLWSRRRF